MLALNLGALSEPNLNTGVVKLAPVLVELAPSFLASSLLDATESFLDAESAEVEFKNERLIVGIVGFGVSLLAEPNLNKPVFVASAGMLNVGVSSPIDILGAVVVVVAVVSLLVGVVVVSSLGFFSVKA